LLRRGGMTLRVDRKAVASRRHHGGSDSRGRPRIYTDTAIAFPLLVKGVFHLGLRATQGVPWLEVQLIAVDLPLLVYTTVCRRQAELDVRLNMAPGKKARHVVVDSTGIKVSGAGEWYARGAVPTIPPRRIAKLRPAKDRLRFSWSATPCCGASLRKDSTSGGG